MSFFFFFSIDRTYKVYIGGAQKRPDGNYSRPVLDPKGEVIGQVAEGNRKDIRDAVEAAHKAAPGCVMTYQPTNSLYLHLHNLHAVSLQKLETHFLAGALTYSQIT